MLSNPTNYPTTNYPTLFPTYPTTNYPTTLIPTLNPTLNPTAFIEGESAKNFAWIVVPLSVLSTMVLAIGIKCPHIIRNWYYLCTCRLSKIKSSEASDEDTSEMPETPVHVEPENPIRRTATV